MKTALLFTLLFFNAALLNFFSTAPDSSNRIQVSLSGKDTAAVDSAALLRNFNFPARNAAFTINCSFQPAQSLIAVSERLVWFNNSPDSLKEIYLHLYLNAFKSNNTVLGQSNPIPKSSLTKLDIASLSVNTIPAELDYVNTDVTNPADSTVCRIKLSKSLRSRDSVTIDISYSFKIPEAFHGIGYNPSHTFFTISSFLIKPGIYKNRQWICSPAYPFTGVYSDFADYNVTLSLPKAFEVVSTGQQISNTEKSRDTNQVSFSAKNVVDFAWCAAPGYKKTLVALSIDENGIQATLFLPNEFSKFIPRYTTSLQKAYAWLHDEVGDLPGKSMSFAVAPENAHGLYEASYPQLSIIGHNLLTPASELLPERLGIQVLAEQYFKSSIASNQVAEGWIAEGLTGYCTDHILQNSFGAPNSFAYFFDVWPVRGLTLIKFADIPLVYTLSTIKVPPEAWYLQNYYTYASISSLAENSMEYHTSALYESAVKARGTIFFHAVRNILGEERMCHFLYGFYSKFKGKQVRAADLIQYLKLYSSGNEFKYISQFYRDGGYSDYAILEAAQIGQSDYVLRIANYGNIDYPVVLSVQTDVDTVITKIDPSKKLQTVYISAKHPVRAFEIDPAHDNLFDVNFANNSYLMEKSYASSIYLSVRWFYWMQSILLIFGGLS